MLVNRRNFLQGFCSFCALMLLACKSKENSREVKSSSDQDLIVYIKSALSYLKHDEQGLQRYADEINAKKINFSKLDDYQKYLLVEKYLMGTDFFFSGKDSSKPVSFVMLRDPYKVPCLNPFAKF